MPVAKLQPRAPRWRRQPGARPQQILEAAFRVFGTRGLHQATLDDVAKAAGITKGTIYLYFPSKAALFTAMLKTRVNAIMPPVDLPLDGRDRRETRALLLGLGQRLYRFFRTPAFLAMYRSVVSEASLFPETAATLYREGILPANQRMAALIQKGIATGEFREVDPLIAARAFVGMFQIFAVSQGLLGGQRIFPISESHVVHAVTDLFFRGLLANSETEARHRCLRGSR